VRYRRNAPEDGRAVVTEWYALLGRVPSLEAWAATWGEADPPGALVEAMRPDYERALVVGFELSPLMRSVLDRLGAPWVDIAVSPIRFLDDLALDMRFSWPVAVAHPGLMAPEHLEHAVARLRARYAGDPAAGDLDGTAVFLAQTRFDRSLIKAGAFFADSEAVARVGAALDGRALVLKPHPLAPDNPILDALRLRFGARTTKANIYAILATAKDTRFLSISSSAAIEARLLGHCVEVFHSGTSAGAPTATSLWAHRSAAFWRAALSPLMPVRAGVDLDERAIPDRLRRSHGAWGWTPHERAGALPSALPTPDADGPVRRIA
jgi:hypothetical protein